MHDLIIVEYVSACVSACIALVLYACTVVSVSSTCLRMYIYTYKYANVNAHMHKNLLICCVFERVDSQHLRKTL